jgi:hypothetical protein
MNSKFSSAVRPLVLLSVAAVLATGCATLSSTTARPLSTDESDAWAPRIQTLPVDIHGTIPGESAAQTVAAVDRGVDSSTGSNFQDTGLSLYSMPRVVVYIGGGSGPERNQYCALQPRATRATFAPKDAVVMRSALCDGPRPVAYARTTLAEANPNPVTVANAIERLKSDLVQSLPSPEPQPPEFGN